MKKVNFELNVNLTTLIIIGIVLFLVFGGFGYLINRNNKLKNDLQQEKNLVVALNDTLRKTINMYGEIVSEKRTLQTTVENLESLNIELTDAQKTLLKRLQEVEKEKSVFAAALIQANLKIDSLVHGGEVFVGDSSVVFTDSTPDFEYSIEVNNVTPINLDLKPQLTFNRLNFPNETFVEFSWEDNKKEGYPISFSVTNTNKYMEVYNIESYAIPSIEKEELDPSTWNKITQWFGRNGGTILKVGIGGTAGYLIGRSVSK